MTSGIQGRGARDEDDPISEADLERVLAVVPRGAAAVAGGAVLLTIAAWLLVYLFVFLPRGPVN